MQSLLLFLYVMFFFLEIRYKHEHSILVRSILIKPISALLILIILIHVFRLVWFYYPGTVGKDVFIRKVSGLGRVVLFYNNNVMSRSHMTKLCFILDPLYILGIIFV